MSELETIPPVCYELVEAIHQHDGLIPYRSLPAKLRDVGLMKVCRRHQLIELVYWYPGTSGSVSENMVAVGAPSGWMPFYLMKHLSEREAVEQDSEWEDVRKSLHVELTDKGDLIHETRRLSGTDFTHPARDSQSNTADVAGYLSADTLWHEHGIQRSRLSEGARKGTISTKAAPRGSTDSQGRRVRVLYNEEDAIRECTPKHRKRK